MIPGDHQTMVRDSSGISSLFSSPPSELVMAYPAILLSESGEDPPRQESPAPIVERGPFSTSLESRFRLLKQLHEQGVDLRRGVSDQKTASPGSILSEWCSVHVRRTQDVGLEGGAYVSRYHPGLPSPERLRGSKRLWPVHFVRRVLTLHSRRAVWTCSDQRFLNTRMRISIRAPQGSDHHGLSGGRDPRRDP